MRPFWPGNVDARGHAMGQMVELSTASDEHRITAELVGAVPQRRPLTGQRAGRFSPRQEIHPPLAALGR